MIVDVNSLSRRFGPIIAQHLCVDALLHQVDADKCSSAYVDNTKDISKLTKITPCKNMISLTIPILTNNTISTRSSTTPRQAPTAFIIVTPNVAPRPTPTALIGLEPNVCPSSAINIFSVPMCLCHTPPSYEHTQSLEEDGNMSSKSLKVTDASMCCRLCLVDVCCSFLSC